MRVSADNLGGLMNKDLELVCQSLEALSVAIIGATAEQRTLTEAFGWNCPTVTKNDLAAMPMQLASRIKEANLDELDNDILPLIKDIPRRIQFLQANTVPYLFNGNAVAAAPAFIGTMTSLAQQFEPLLSWQYSGDSKAMPPKIAKRLRSLAAELDEIMPDKDILKGQIKLIQEAYETAESLPTDLQALKDVQAKVKKIADETSSILEKILPKEKIADDSIINIKANEAEASKLIKLCEDAYHITTTKGLAGAFEDRAKKLADSMYVWVLGLIGALFLGVVIGSKSFIKILEHLSITVPNWGVVFMDITIAILSIGGPVWFAWVATKQIGQRFRLAEDYSFKASVAKAYEGYRKEAAKLDPAFEARLFSSALTRLEEAPLRLIEAESHGSPWHELFASKPFQKALNTIPELKDKFVEVAKEGVEKITQKTI